LRAVRFSRRVLASDEIGRHCGTRHRATVAALKRPGYVEPPRAKGFAARTPEQRAALASPGGQAARGGQGVSVHP
jgi:hypothetical protein